MSSCTECHGMAGEKYDDHGSFDCPRLKNLTPPNNTGIDSDGKLKSIIGEMPNFIFDYLELSEDIKREWKYGDKASDFGGHNQFVHKYAKRIEAHLNKAVADARLAGEKAGRSDELVKLAEWGKTIDKQWNDHFEQRLQALKRKERNG